MTPKTVTIIGRRWFNRGPGNTYFSAQTWVDGEPGPSIDFEYGYGDHYLDRAFEELERAQLVPQRARHNNGSYEAPPSIWCRDVHGIKLVYSVSDVSRRRDL